MPQALEQNGLQEANKLGSYGQQNFPYISYGA